MPKFRKRPVVVEAVQLRWDNWSEMCDFLGREFFERGGRGNYPRGDEIGLSIPLSIPTLEGTMQAFAGDWVIRGVNGELYPCKPDIFDKTYEAVQE